MSVPSPSASNTHVILEHYRKEAELFGRDASSTMRDSITRGREVAGVTRTLDWLESKKASVQSILDIGCGNGFLLEVLRGRRPSVTLEGLEYTPEMVEIARVRKVERCTITQGDVRKLPYEKESWDIVATERCIVNVLDKEEQAQALREVARVLKKGGHFLCIEAFQDSLDALNEARAELGLPPNEVPYHNVWFGDASFKEVVTPHFEIVDLSTEGDLTLPTPNFLSSHYFMSRVVYPAVTKKEIIYNTHFVKFFSTMASAFPPIGDYSPVRFYLLKKR